jgi:hypothetical protein
VSSLQPLPSFTIEDHVTRFNQVDVQQKKGLQLLLHGDSTVLLHPHKQDAPHCGGGRTWRHQTIARQQCAATRVVNAAMAQLDSVTESSETIIALQRSARTRQSRRRKTRSQLLWNACMLLPLASSIVLPAPPCGAIYDPKQQNPCFICRTSSCSCTSNFAMAPDSRIALRRSTTCKAPTCSVGPVRRHLILRIFPHW